MIILDEINPAARKPFGDIGELGDGKPLRLKGGASQRPARHPRPLSQAWQAVAGPTEGGGQRSGNLEVLQRDIILKLTIPEQHVQELPGIVPDRRRSKANAHREYPIGRGFDRLNLPDNIG